MYQAQALFQLQEIDLNILRRQKRLSEIAAILADDQQVAAAQAQVTAAQQALTPLRTRARNLELEIQSSGQKAQSTEDQLYSGSVKNTKEMRDMQQEITALRKRRGELEETLLDTMVSIEDGEAALKDAETELARVLETQRDAHGHLIDEQVELQAQVAKLREQRELALKTVEPDNLTRYKTLRQKKGSQPLALLQGSNCGVCGVQQTMAIEREVRQGQSLVMCQNCGRILVYMG
jgi:uncharacterized protein